MVAVVVVGFPRIFNAHFNVFVSSGSVTLQDGIFEIDLLARPLIDGFHFFPSVVLFREKKGKILRNCLISYINTVT